MSGSSSPQETKPFVILVVWYLGKTRGARLLKTEEELMGQLLSEQYDHHLVIRFYDSNVNNSESVGCYYLNDELFTDPVENSIPLWK